MLIQDEKDSEKFTEFVKQLNHQLDQANTAD
jgi:hypothetical protein